MRSGVGFVLAVGALLVSPLAAAGDGSHPVVLVGGGLGLTGVGDLPGPLFEGHAGGGWRAQMWTAAGVVAYAYTEGEAVLGGWSIVRHDVELVGVMAFRPVTGRAFHVHGQLGIGAAFDRLRGDVGEGAARTLSASFGAGAGWGPVALTFRLAVPEPAVCADASRCFSTGGVAQVLLSLTFDVVSLPR